LKHISVRDQKPYGLHPKQTVDFDGLYKAAEQHLVDTVRGYKQNFGKSGVDQMRLMPEDL